MPEKQLISWPAANSHVVLGHLLWDEWAKAVSRKPPAGPPFAEMDGYMLPLDSSQASTLVFDLCHKVSVVEEGFPLY